MLFRLAAALALGVLLLAARPARAAQPQDSESPYQGITYTLWLDSTLPARIHVVSIDLTSASIDLIATKQTQRGQTPSAFAGAAGAVVAINGDYFAPSGYLPDGLARGDSQTWEGTGDDDQSGFVSFYHDAARTQVTLSAPSQVVDSVPDQTVGAVSGRPLLVQGGAAVPSFACEDLVAMPCDPAPRTAVAMSADGNTLYMVVVDGWQSSSAGMTARQLADFLAGDLGADKALMLDGGSASALFFNGDLKSAPSDGVERPVANHLAVRYGAQPDGTIRGGVFERTVGGTKLSGVTVTLDDGTSKSYDGDTDWQFSVAPRWVCVTATKSGYHPNTGCRQVQSTQMVYDSIALFPNSDFVDGGPGGTPDASANTPDAGLLDIPDAAPGNGAADAGDPGGGVGGGCGCSAGGHGSGRPAALGGLFLFCVVLTGLRRRRFRQGPR